MPRLFQQQWQGNGDILLTLPFFWSEAWIGTKIYLYIFTLLKLTQTLDPDFSVLLGGGSDSSSSGDCVTATDGGNSIRYTVILLLFLFLLLLK